MRLYIGTKEPKKLPAPSFRVVQELRYPAPLTAVGTIYEIMFCQSATRSNCTVGRIFIKFRIVLRYRHV